MVKSPGPAQVSAEPSLYPPLEPYREDWLDAGQGHRVRFEESGNPRGIPVVFLHGGPGSGTNPNQRRFFDPARYRIVLLDQRGAGRSAPAGETRANTTPHLVQDLERLRAALGLSRWLLFGGSWGATLALAYAIAHPHRVSGVILRGVFLGSRSEVAWYTGGLRAFVPEAWARFFDASGARLPSGIVEGYRRRLRSSRRAMRLAAAAAWSEYESTLMAVHEDAVPRPAPADDALVARVRVQLHYLAHDCFLAPGALLRGVRRLRGVPALIVQGRLDLVCPPLTARRLQAAWPGCELNMVERAGHGAFDPRIAPALVAATRRFSDLPDAAGVQRP